MALFEIRKRSPRPNNSLITPAAAASLKGVAFQESATDGTAELADGTKSFAGFATRDVLVGGPVLGDVIYPGRLELAVQDGQENSFEFGEEIEAEGSDYLDATLTAGAALKSRLTFAAGKFIPTSTGKYSQFMLVAKPTPEVAGNVRIRAIPINAVLEP